VHAKDNRLLNNTGAILFTIKVVANLLFVVREAKGWVLEWFETHHKCFETQHKWFGAHHKWLETHHKRRARRVQLAHRKRWGIRANGADMKAHRRQSSRAELRGGAIPIGEAMENPQDSNNHT